MQYLDLLSSEKNMPPHKRHVFNCLVLHGSDHRETQSTSAAHNINVCDTMLKYITTLTKPSQHCVKPEKKQAEQQVPQSLPALFHS